MKQNDYLSYSLWGNNPIFNVGILKNIEQAHVIYPGWNVIVYYDDSVPYDTIVEIKKSGAVAVNVTGKSYGMFWRFFAADLPDCRYAIFRDADSRLSFREKKAVDEWIKSGRPIHIMRDHPFHRIPYGTDSLSILGGMWGVKGNLFPMEELIETFSQNKKLDYGIDQTFLKEIYIKFKDDACVHDEFFAKKPFPLKREGYRFVGERMDQNDKPVGDDWKYIKEYYHNKKYTVRAYRLSGKFFKKLKALIQTL